MSGNQFLSFLDTAQGQTSEQPSPNPSPISAEEIKSLFGFDPSHASTQPTTEENLQCHLCNKEFASKFNLESHLQVHSRDQPFACHLCPSKFKRKHDYFRHLRRFHLDYWAVFKESNLINAPKGGKKRARRTKRGGNEETALLQFILSF